MKKWFLHNILKWGIQVSTMLTDIIIILVAIGLVYETIVIGSIPIYVISASLLVLGYLTWKSQGGFIAWTSRKKFSDNFYKIYNINKDKK